MTIEENLKELNSAQYEAATSITGRNFILAGAGSGKTKVLVTRVAYMLSDYVSGIEPEEILLLTFTNKAAKVMKDRIAQMIGEKAAKVTACTFHSFCANFIRKNSHLLGFTYDYTIIDSTDMLDAISICMQDYIADYKAAGNTYTSKDFPAKRNIGQVYEMAVNNCVSYKEAIASIGDELLDRYEDSVIDILTRFKKYKKERNLLDYNDLLYYTEKLLDADEELRAKVDEQYKFISCDEYQDTNTIQNRILELMSRDYQNLTVVGDDNQSIYAFRYANINNILNFDKKYPECKTIVLDTNYRSSQEILDFANAMMSYATEGKEKHLQGLFHGEKPQMMVVDDCYKEAQYIIDRIKDEKYELQNTAVICRSSMQSYILEQMLNMEGIPYNKFGGIKFLEKATIKDILSYLRIGLNEKDEIAMFRVLQLYPGIGKTYAKKVSEIIANDGFDAAIEKYKKRVFAESIEELKNEIRKYTKYSLNEQLTYLIDTYYKDVKDRAIQAQDVDESEKITEYQELKENLNDAKMLITMAKKYRSVSRFLADLVLDAVVEKDDDDKLNITTIHSAKGLEYDRVFIMDCIEGVTPSCEEYSKEDAEELRCMYVAVTRAKHELYLMVPKFYNLKAKAGRLSHFINKEETINTTLKNVTDRVLERLVTGETYWNF